MNSHAPQKYQFMPLHAQETNTQTEQDKQKIPALIRIINTNKYTHPSTKLTVDDFDMMIERVQTHAYMLLTYKSTHAVRST